MSATPIYDAMVAEQTQRWRRIARLIVDMFYGRPCAPLAVALLAVGTADLALGHPIGLLALAVGVFFASVVACRFVLLTTGGTR